MSIHIAFILGPFVFIYFTTWTNHRQNCKSFCFWNTKLKKNKKTFNIDCELDSYQWPPSTYSKTLWVSFGRSCELIFNRSNGHVQQSVQAKTTQLWIIQI